MSKASAAASIVGGLLLAVIGVVGFAVLVVLALADVYSAGMVLWIGLPLIFAVGAALSVYGLVVAIGEVSGLAGDIGGLTDVESIEDVKRLYRRVS